MQPFGRDEQPYRIVSGVSTVMSLFLMSRAVMSVLLMFHTVMSLFFMCHTVMSLLLMCRTVMSLLLMCHTACAQFSSNAFSSKAFSSNPIRLGLDENLRMKRCWTKMNWSKSRSTVIQ